MIGRLIDGECMSCTYVCIHTCVCGGGIKLCNLPVVIPGSWAMALPIARRGAVGVAPHHVPCTSQVDVQNLSAFKTKKDKSASHKKSSTFSSESHGFVHAKSRTRIGCRTFRPRRPLSTVYKTKETAA